MKKYRKKSAEKITQQKDIKKQSKLNFFQKQAKKSEEIEKVSAEIEQQNHTSSRRTRKSSQIQNQKNDDLENNDQKKPQKRGRKKLSEKTQEKSEQNQKKIQQFFQQSKTINATENITQQQQRVTRNVKKVQKKSIDENENNIIKKIKQEEEQQQEEEEEDNNIKSKELSEDYQQEEDISEEEEFNGKSKTKSKVAAKPKKNSKKQSKLIKEKQVEKVDENKPKGKRGFKFCKNEDCKQLIYIHQKTCPHCNFSNAMKHKSAENQDKNQNLKKDDQPDKNFHSPYFNENLINKIRENKPIPVKYQASIHTFKKDFLFREIYNILQEQESVQKQNIVAQNNQVQQAINQNIITSQKLEFPNQFFENYSKIFLNCQKLDVEKNEQLFIQSYGKIKISGIGQLQQGKEYQGEEDKQQFKTKSSNLNKDSVNLDLLDFFSYKNDEKSQYFQEYFINLGHPIQSIAFAQNQSQKTQTYKNNQYFAVSLEINENCQIDDFRYQTMQKFGLLKCHNFSSQAEKQSLIAVFQIEFNEQNNSFETVNLLYFTIVPSTLLSIQFMPYIENESQDLVGILGGIGFDGKFYLFKFPKIKTSSSNKKLLKADPYLIITNKSLGKLECFDFYCHKDNKLIAFGDFLGNIQIVQLDENLSNYKVIQFFNNAHQTFINDIKFYQQYNPEFGNCLLFATAGNDGYVKIFDLYQGFDPIFEIDLLCKQIQGLQWDKGGKYIIAIKEDNNFCSVMISWFSTQEKNGGGSNLQPFNEKRYVNTNSIDMGITSSHSNNSLYVCNKRGQIFRTLTEVARKFAVKKSKINQKNQKNTSIVSLNMGLQYYLQCSQTEYPMKKNQHNFLVILQNNQKQLFLQDQDTSIQKLAKIENQNNLDIHQQRKNSLIKEKQENSEKNTKKQLLQSSDSDASFDEISQTAQKIQSKSNQKSVIKAIDKTSEQEKNVESENYNFNIQHNISAMAISQNNFTIDNLHNGLNQKLEHFLVIGNYAGLLRIVGVEQVEQ
ncbi:WD40-repeat-containing domain [Pseudocohnilembus persalinus]|uniref:WD40-repeat-containing domain n=1 Tax=Pseudocohnilembus persalinus TaxID=266149 RepID=A0A0V0QJ98_PSEPJ|nr:WD40-repeat-containing domain [Pseudocohnilembus persalinus]|eukprot:KRX02387.1 WD40-repeat-containing domain [Pseudocohnilembus persalinus]